MVSGRSTFRREDLPLVLVPQNECIKNRGDTINNLQEAWFVN